MKIIAGLATLVVGVIIVILGFTKGAWLLILLGAIVTYTGYRVLAA